MGRAWPREFGGGGRTAVEQIIVDQELAAAGAPEFVNVVGLDVLGPSLLRFGNDEQRRRYIPSILSADDIWCQGFSEPDAGSDLASLRTRAVEDGDQFVLSGQKTWVSWGQFARWCGVLARTEDVEPDRPRHKGISMLIVDMHSPGVEVRPMTQITGHAEFCELFLDEVVVPKENLLSRTRRRLEDRDVHARPRARHGGAPPSGQAAHVARPAGSHRGRPRARRARRCSTIPRLRSPSRRP